MSRYVPRPGIVKTKICGQTVLIPSRQAFSECQKIQRLSLVWLGVWNGLNKGKTMEEITDFLKLLTKQPDEEIQRGLDEFLRQLCDNGFLIEIPEEA